MKPEQQVCSLELAQKLKELGMKQSSIFWWTKDDMEATYLITGETLPILHARYARTPHQSMPEDYGWRECVELYSAFTVAELGEMLPARFASHIEITRKKATCFDSRTQVGVGMFTHHREDADTEADARAKMLIYLLENNLIHSLK